MKNLTIVIALFSTASVFAGGGNGVGNGGDSVPLDVGSAWFLGQQNSFNICYELAGNFGVDKKTAEKAILDSVSTWKKYFTDKHIADTGVFDPLFQPTMTASILPACTGSEDLKIYFGTSSAEVVTARAAYFDPVAFAHRSSYDLDKGRGKGFIWISLPQHFLLNWAQPYLLNGILLHEFGHVFGCEHVGQTIMDEDILNLLEMAPTDTTAARALLGNIDGEKELYLDRWDGLSFSGTLGIAAGEDADRADTFKRLVGRLPVGPVSATLTFTYVTQITLTLSDSLGATDVIVSNSSSKGALVQGNATIFKATRNQVESGMTMMESQGDVGGEGSTSYWQVLGYDKQPYLVFLERNTGSVGSPAHLTLVVDGNVRDLFVTLLPWVDYGHSSKNR